MKKVLKIGGLIALCVSCGSEVVDFPGDNGPFSPISDLPCPPDGGNGEVLNPNGPLPDLTNPGSSTSSSGSSTSSSSSTGGVAVNDAGSSDASDAGDVSDASDASSNDAGDAGTTSSSSSSSSSSGGVDDGGLSSSSSSSSSGSSSSSSSSSSGSSGTSSSSSGSSGSDHECTNQTGLTCEQKLHCCMDACQDAHKTDEDSAAHTACVQACAKAHKVCVFLRLPLKEQAQICAGSK